VNIAFTLARRMPRRVGGATLAHSAAEKQHKFTSVPFNISKAAKEAFA